MKDKQTPLMRQYTQIKEKYPETILLFRLGDFFETFEDDAVITSKVCGITLTKRNNGAAGDMPLAGFPHHQLDAYLPKLVKAGYRVAVCEQLEDPKMAKGIVKRDVVEVVTPGVALYDKLLDSKRNNYVASVYFSEHKNSQNMIGLAFCDISTGEFFVSELHKSKINEVLESISPAEIIISKSQRQLFNDIISASLSEVPLARLEEWIFEYDFCKEKILNLFNSKNLKGFGVEDMQSAVVAAGVTIHYISETQKGQLSHIKQIRYYNYSEFMLLDYGTRRNLEILFNSEGQSAGSLIDVLDETCTAMGARLLKKWISRPLNNIQMIHKRLNSVEALFNNPKQLSNLRIILKSIDDLERLASKIASNRANPRDIVSLKNSLAQIPSIKTDLHSLKNEALKELADKLTELKDLIDLISNAIIDEPSIQVGSGNIFKQGYNAELDEYILAKYSGKKWISDFQESEREKSGINTLKIGFNNVFGYYIEITRVHSAKVPEYYQRKQTLANAERYTTPELKVFEEKILNAEEKISLLESNLIADIRLKIAEFISEIQSNSLYLASLDCLQSFAHVSKENNYIKPIIDESFEMKIVDGRHPVVEKTLSVGEKYTPNSCKFDDESGMVHIITGPNMAGKSCYLRQTALIVLLGQIGCFVPAKSAEFGVVDRIFTRVGAQDNIRTGESTFLVEMQEAANILNNASERSLILLDEVGRGTATFDGISIAWSIAEYIHDKINAKTLFATHYHELNDMESKYDKIKNYRVDVIESGKNIIFTHKVSQGSSDHSFGIHVAKMAGLPYDVIEKANSIMESFEKDGESSRNISKPDTSKIEVKKKSDVEQLSIFEFRDDSLRERINELNIDNITPVQALQILADLKAETRGRKKKN